MRQQSFIVGTRKSQLALTQTNALISRLSLHFPECQFSVKTISTAGDRSAGRPALFDRQGIFVKEIEDALLKGEIDLAVHSLKDMPCDISKGLALGAICERCDPRDALISRQGIGFLELKSGAVIGTSSIRRKAQILAARQDISVVELRGNVDTRLKKLDAGEVDAIVLAAAGLMRLAQDKRISQLMPLDMMLPAPCQGAIGIEVRCDDVRSLQLVSKLDDAVSRACVTAERAFSTRRRPSSCSGRIRATWI